MYLTLGNISKDIWCQPSKHAAILIAYLPISKLECFMRDIHSVKHYRLFHYCMAQVLEPLVSAGENGVKVTCPDLQVRWMLQVTLTNQPQLGCEGRTLYNQTTQPRDGVFR